MKDLEAEFELTFELNEEHDKEKNLELSFLKYSELFNKNPIVWVGTTLVDFPLTDCHNTKKQNGKAKSDRLSFWENYLMLTNF